MAAIRLTPGTKEYLKLTVTSEYHPLTNVPIHVADVAEDVIPRDGDWVEPTLVQRPDPHTIEASVLVTASTVPDTTRDLWYRLTDSPEVPIRRAGRYTVV